MFAKLKKWQTAKLRNHQETLRLSTKGKRYNFTISPFEQEDRLENTKRSQLKPIALQSSVGEVVQQVHGGELHDISQICKKVQAEGQRVGDDKGKLFLEREQNLFLSTLP